MRSLRDSASDSAKIHSITDGRQISGILNVRVGVALFDADEVTELLSSEFESCGSKLTGPYKP